LNEIVSAETALPHTVAHENREGSFAKETQSVLRSQRAANDGLDSERLQKAGVSTDPAKALCGAIAIVRGEIKKLLRVSTHRFEDGVLLFEVVVIRGTHHPAR
jgi:hypothetical protein